MPQARMGFSIYAWKSCQQELPGLLPFLSVFRVRKHLHDKRVGTHALFADEAAHGLDLQRTAGRDAADGVHEHAIEAGIAAVRFLEADGLEDGAFHAAVEAGNLVMRGNELVAQLHAVSLRDRSLRRQDAETHQPLRFLPAINLLRRHPEGQQRNSKNDQDTFHRGRSERQ